MHGLNFLNESPFLEHHMLTKYNDESSSVDGVQVCSRHTVQQLALGKVRWWSMRISTQFHLARSIWHPNRAAKATVGLFAEIVCLGIERLVIPRLSSVVLETGGVPGGMPLVWDRSVVLLRSSVNLKHIGAVLLNLVHYRVSEKLVTIAFFPLVTDSVFPLLKIRASKK